jgi:hypothetical protein
MKIGLHYRMNQIFRMDWEKLAKELYLSPQTLLNKIREMADQLPAAADIVAAGMTRSGIEHPVVGVFLEKLTSRREACTRRSNKGCVVYLDRFNWDFRVRVVGAIRG